MQDISRKKLGQLKELEAKRFLQGNGLALIEQNYRCYHGEIDLIMRDRDDIVFVEVRSRRRLDYGRAAETVNKNKQTKLARTAMHFLQKRDWLYKVNSRFDIIAMQKVDGEWQLEWIKNAFFSGI
ncbi:YraN family protein [Aquicella siphonis]|nr:YraN family protein [Aquicella siphonis]